MNYLKKETWKLELNRRKNEILESVCVETIEDLFVEIVLSLDLLVRGCVANDRFIDNEWSVVGVVVPDWTDEDDEDVWRERVVCWANVLKLLFGYSQEKISVFFKREIQTNFLS